METHFCVYKVKERDLQIAFTSVTFLTKHLPPEVLALESDLASLSSSDIKAISCVVKQLKEKYQ